MVRNCSLLEVTRKQNLWSEAGQCCPHVLQGRWQASNTWHLMGHLYWLQPVAVRKHIYWGNAPGVVIAVDDLVPGGLYGGSQYCEIAYMNEIFAPAVCSFSPYWSMAWMTLPSHKCSEAVKHHLCRRYVGKSRKHFLPVEVLLSQCHKNWFEVLKYVVGPQSSPDWI